MILNLLDINSSGEEVSGDENPGRSRPELPHDHVTLALVHVSVLVVGGVGRF